MLVSALAGQENEIKGLDLADVLAKARVKQGVSVIDGVIGNFLEILFFLFSQAKSPEDQGFVVCRDERI